MDNNNMNQNDMNQNQAYNQPNMNQQFNTIPVQTVDNSGKAVPALICGILSIPGGLAIPLVGIILGCIGIALGNKAKNSIKAGMGKGGFICGIIGIVLSVLNMILGIILGVAIFANM